MQLLVPIHTITYSGVTTAVGTDWVKVDDLKGYNAWARLVGGSVRIGAYTERPDKTDSANDYNLLCSLYSGWKEYVITNVKYI